MTPPHGCRGFTLVEVLVALAIVAIAMAALVQAAGSAASNQALIEERSYAHWVAMNQIALQQIAALSKSASASTSGSESMVGREWPWSVETRSTRDPTVERITVSVLAPGDPTRRVLTLGGYRRTPP